MSTSYDILGVSEHDSVEHIKKRYRVLAMKNHPDRGGDSVKFQEIKQAYEEILKERELSVEHFSFDPSSDAFFKKMFGNNLGPWR